MSSENVEINTESPIVERPVIDPETTVFIGNVAHEATEEDLENVFKGEFGSVEVTIPEKEHIGDHIPVSKHAFVKFPQTIDFDAIKTKYDLTVIKEREIHIKRARTADELRGSSRGRFGRGRGGIRGRGGRGSRGSFRGRGRGGFARRPRIPLDEMERSTDTLYVNNVPFDATKDQLADFFGASVESIVLPMRRLRDEVTRKTIPSDKFNRGMAFVTFTNLSGKISDKVDEFNGKSLADRALIVDVAVVKPEEDHENTDETSNNEIAE